MGYAGKLLGTAGVGGVSVKSKEQKALKTLEGRSFTTKVTLAGLGAGSKAKDGEGQGISRSALASCKHREKMSLKYNNC